MGLALATSTSTMGGGEVLGFIASGLFEQEIKKMNDKERIPKIPDNSLFIQALYLIKV